MEFFPAQRNTYTWLPSGQISSPNSIVFPPLHDAIIAGNTRNAVRLLSSKADPNERDSLGQAPLHKAAAKADTDAIMALLNARANVNAKTSEDRTPLHKLCKHFVGPVNQNNLVGVQALLDGKVDVNAQTNLNAPLVDRRLETALHCAARSGWSEAMEMLVQAKADLTKESATGVTALDVALDTDHFMLFQDDAGKERCARLVRNALLQQAQQSSGQWEVLAALSRALQETDVVCLDGRRISKEGLFQAALIQATVTKDCAVRITGLVSQPDLNGLQGTAVKFVAEKGRWEICLQGRDRPLGIRPENMELFKARQVPWEAVQQRESEKMAANVRAVYRLAGREYDERTAEAVSNAEVRGQCVICFDQEAQFVAIECKHLVSCLPCRRALVHEQRTKQGHANPSRNKLTNKQLRNTDIECPMCRARTRLVRKQDLGADVQLFVGMEQD